MSSFYFLLVLIIPFFNISIAAEIIKMSPLAPLEVSCREEVISLCVKNDNREDLFTCLKQQHDKISSRCQEDVSRIISEKQSVPNSERGAFGSFPGLGMSHNSSPRLTYEGRIIPNHDAPSVSENKINFSMPLYRKDNHFLSVSTQESIFHLDKPLLLDSGTMIPTNYYRTELGTSYLQTMPEKRSVGVRASVGYNTDKPFMNGRDLSFSVSSHYNFPSTEYSSWAITLHFSNNGSLPNYIPIPGFIYFYRTSSFTGMFGLPFASFQWTPVLPWSYSFSLFGLNINSEVAYGRMEKVQYFSGYSLNKQSYMLHDRVNFKDRLIFQEKKIFVGIRGPLWNKLASEFQCGDSFGRRVYIGRSSLKNDDQGAKMTSSLYASWMMKVIF